MYKVFLGLFACLLFIDPSFSQTVLEDQGEVFFSKKNYNEALPVYKQLFKMEPDNYEYNYRLAVCYLKTFSNRAEAIYHLEYITRKNPKNFETWVLLGKAYQYSNRYDDAIEAFEKSKLYAKEKSLDIVEREIEICLTAKELYKYPLDVTFYNLGSSINSKYPEYYPLIPEDESFMIFTARKPDIHGGIPEGDGYYPSDIFMTYPKDGKWIPPKNIGNAVNTSFDEQAVSLAANGQKLLVYLDRVDSLGNIYFSEKDKTGFKNLIRLPDPVNDGFETSGFLSQDEQVILVASERPGGYGQKDIYEITKLPNGKWSMAKNLGTNINTKYNEDFPCLSKDGKSLYFASEGHATMGGFDIFKSKWNEVERNWSAPENIGFPINDSYDNMNITFAGDSSQAYISSVKEDSQGDLDIYKVKFNKVTTRYCLITGYITTDSIESNVKKTILVSRSNSKEVLKYVPIKKNGKYVMALLPNTYNVVIKAEGYEDITFPYTVYDVPFQPEVNKDFQLKKIITKGN